jgi:hypothetical protein
MTKDEASKMIRRMRDRDRELVTGIVRNHEASNGSYAGNIRFTYKMYPGDPHEMYEFHHNERVTIPRGVARHLKNNCYTYSYNRLDENLQQAIMPANFKSNRPMSAHTKTKVHRFSFTALDFMDDEDMYAPELPEIIEVKMGKEPVSKASKGI